MKKILFILFVCIEVSCQKGENAGNKSGSINKDTTSEKYQMDVFQSSADDFNVICLNRFTGSVFIRNNNGIWYNAQDLKNLKKYDTPVYSIKIIKGNNEKTFQVVLLNSMNGNVYIRSYSSSWYEALGVRGLDN